MELEFRINNFKVEHPLGWDKLKLTLERHQEYHGIIEYIDTDLIWIGDAAELIINAIQTSGPDALLNLQVFWNYNNTNILLYTGQLDLKLVEIIHFGNPLKVKCPVIQESTWSRFINNKDKYYQISTAVTVTLPGQMLPYQFKLQEKIASESGSFSIGTSLYLMHHFDQDIDEFEAQNYGMNISTEAPVPVKKYFLRVKYGGQYQVNYQVIARISTSPSNLVRLRWFYAINGTITQMGSHVDSAAGELELVRSLSTTWTLNAGDEIYFYGLLERVSGTSNPFTFASWNSYPASPPLYPDPYNLYTDLQLNAQTFDANSEVKLINLNTAFTQLIQQATATTPLISIDTRYLIGIGKHLRGFEPVNFPLSISFDRLFQSVNSWFPVGVWFNGTQIVIADASTFYVNASAGVYDADLNTVIKLDNARLIKSIEFGYQKWESETAGGVNDVHARVTWGINLRITGTDVKRVSEIIASGYAIEATRRQRIKLDVDWKMDENVFVIALNDDLEPEIASASGLPYFPQPANHFNTRLIPGENMKRWLPFISALQGLGYDYEITARQGRVRLSDSPIAMSGKLFGFRQITAELSIDYSDYLNIKSNRHKYFVINAGDETYEVFVQKLEYSIFEGKATLTGIQR